MWYFAWILGMPLACCLAILNAMWLEIRSDDERYGRRRRYLPSDNEV